MRQPVPALLLLAQAAHASLLPDPTNPPSIQRSTHTRTDTDSTLEFTHNSGICETSPGVNQYSGYLSIGKEGRMHMWFWFFEARNSPESAPLVAWLNGGPGCSSMIGLFQENGPCMFPVAGNRTDSGAGDGGGEPIFNPYSYSNHANVVYIDQPVGTGFSYSDDDGSVDSESAQVNSTASATGYAWRLLQAFYGHFPGLQGRGLGIFTESYGGHYGPALATYIQHQNQRIDEGALPGHHIIPLTALGVNNGWFDAAIQYRAQIDYAYDNPYRQLITASQRAAFTTANEDHCRPAVAHCTEASTDAACRLAEDACLRAVQDPLARATDFNGYDLRQPADDPLPGHAYVSYLQRTDVVRRIGARTEYTDCAGDVFERFEGTGDNPRSSLATLATLLDSGINVLLWAGDADWICNWAGTEAVANAAVTSSGHSSAAQAFREEKLEPYTVHGIEKGLFKREANLTLLRVFGAGHEVGFYQPEVSLQVFEQALRGRAYST